MIISYHDRQKRFIESSVDSFYRNLKIDQKFTFDYVIVGAGSAGSVVANKLSNDPNNKVLLIEEGGYSTDIYRARDTLQYAEHFILSPDMSITKIFQNARYEATNNRVIESLRGKVAGGCNAINGMVASIGNSYDYNDWATITGESAWAWNNTVYPIHIPDIFEHIPLKYNNDSDSINSELRDALGNLGYEHNTNQFDGSTYGFTLSVATQKLGEDGLHHRVTSFSQYVDSISRVRNNLSIFVRHKALRIDFDTTVTPPRAKGIYLKNVFRGEYIYVEIGKELILSAGAYDSPLLLQFSGVGDPNHLSKFGIETVINSPYVGKNMVDHLSMAVVGRPLKYHGQRVFKRDDSPYNGYRVFGPKSTDKKIKWVNSMGAIPLPLIFGTRFLCSIEMVAPTTVGYIEIERLEYDNETFERPLLRVNHLSDPVEMDYVIDGLNSCKDTERELIKMDVINEHGGSFGLIDITETNIDRIKSSIRSSIMTAYHPHGTLRMGPQDDITYPTNGQLKLKGSANIRIIDASVIPISPSGNTNLPSIIVGLQGSKFILNDN
ncbi:glucose-methanol-choline oxidoreductase [Heterostelium album PN500]|uniref:Glucose-methanol-choline oxidoreductase n=1 Tax=Heterostelium pallidum (strain ATCC 26659 / Pp 5 / PN500) TaxID=670386 RepID=D3BJH4_HETP5|nr:glucose-methanol-choline oxidoreductase [Heterostelium album PN500]EFA78054.1 glucose-methanol-choline oxidoreductase [Heterostelium album PN500]|eukprot:XP_020430181.1 glucose-methanol-choline oxidoreductase [Heterostelium album PN500]